MCGLAAIYAYRDSAPPVDAAELERINRAMHLRGPDDEGTWFGDENRIGLAHRRLAILDPSPAGHQPMVLKDDNGDVRLAITYNGEIYNFGALRAQLEAAGHTFKRVRMRRFFFISTTAMAAICSAVYAACTALPFGIATEGVSGWRGIPLE